MKKQTFLILILSITLLSSIGYFFLGTLVDANNAVSTPEKSSTFPVQKSPSIEELASKRSDLITNHPENIRSLVREIDKKIAILAKRSLPEYVLKKYATLSPQARTIFTEAFKRYAETDPRASESPFYLAILAKRIQSDELLHEDRDLFRSYVHILLVLRDSGKNMLETMVNEKKILLSTLGRVDSGKYSVDTKIEDRTQYRETFQKIGKNIWSIDDISAMRREIIADSIGVGTPFFRAYVYARARVRVKSPSLNLSGLIMHEKQHYGLSCESNSMRDFVGYYRTIRKEPMIQEESIILSLPSHPDPSVVIETPTGKVRIWGDPDKEFVGKIDGRQSSNPNKFTGYGIHADWILPLINETLQSSWLVAKKYGFDEDRILESLSEGNPIMFWYVYDISPGRFAAMEWQTPAGRRVTGYVWEHTGVITWATFDSQWHIRTISYYEGKSDGLRTEPFESLSRKAKWFDTALFISPL